MIKKRKILSLILVATVVFTGFTLPVRGVTVNETTGVNTKKSVVAMVKRSIETQDYTEGELLVVLKPEYSSKQAVFKVGDFPEVSATKIENLTYCNNPDSELIADEFRTVLSITLKQKTEEDMLQAVNKIMDRKDVESVSINEIAPAEATQTVPTSDTQYEAQWALKKIDAMGAWSKTTGSASVKVGIIDTGIDYEHEELKESMWKNPGEIPGDGIDNDHNGYVDDVYGWDFWENDSKPLDTLSHGTFCAGIIAADLNHKDIAGTAPGVKLVALRVGDDGFYGSAAVKALTYAANMGIDVINYSSSFSSKQSSFEAALRNYTGIFVTSAGNDGRDNEVTANYPKTSEHNNVIKVASTTSNDALSSFSNYGSVDVTLAAPGTDILSTTLKNTYTYSSGTSFSSPYTAGVVALIKSIYNGLSRQEIIDSIKEGVDILPSLNGKVATGGRLNANKAMEAARYRSMALASGNRIKVYNYSEFKEAMENDYYSKIYVMRDIQLQDEINITSSKMLYGGSKIIGSGKRHFVFGLGGVTLDLGGLILENGGIMNNHIGVELRGSGAVIQDNYWYSGGAIYNLNGSMKIDGIRIENCSAEHGGAICSLGKLDMKDTTIYKNHATFGGAIYTEGSPGVTISGGIIKSNSADTSGGAISGLESSQIILKDSAQIIENTALANGGGILTNGKLTLIGATIKNNIAKNSGGGIYGSEDSNIIVQDTPYIANNKATNEGGGVFTKGQLKTESPTGLKISSNTADYGGGIYGYSGANISLVGVSPGGPSITIENNAAGRLGGGVYLNTDADLYLHNTFLAVNKASMLGGAMFIRGNYTSGGFVQLVSNTPDGIVYK